MVGVMLLFGWGWDVGCDFSAVVGIYCGGGIIDWRLFFAGKPAVQMRKWKKFPAFGRKKTLRPKR